MSILTFHNLSQSYGASDIFAGLHASMPPKAKIGLVGANGIGKTTLLRLLAGQQKPKSGGIHLAKGTTVGYLQQEAMHAFRQPQNSVYAEMLTAFADVRALESQLRELEAKMSAGDFSEALLEKYGAIQDAFELAGGYDYDVRIRQALDGLGFRKEHWEMPLAHCSGGQKTRALLARLLLEQPDLLILDEPTNHLDVAAIEWLEGYLRMWSGALLIVSHDRYFLDRVVNSIWEMTRNGIESYRGNYSAYLRQREERWALRDEEFEATKANFLRKLDFIKRNIVRASSTDRAKGEMRRLVRQVKAVEIGGTAVLNMDWSQFSAEMGVSGSKWNVAQVEQRIKALENPNPRHMQLKMRLEAGAKSGRLILQSHDLEIGYPQTPLFTADDIRLYRQECAAFIGPNGTGKTTFLRTLMQQLKPLAGNLQVGMNIRLGYFDQAHHQLQLENSVLDELLRQRNMPISEARNHLARYLFRGEDVYKLVKSLSGGERGRLALAILALQDANVLLLDEPTNHLDLPAQEVLQDALQAFDGTVLLVTHDRYLVNKLATQIWSLEGSAKTGYHLHVHQGDYQSFLAAKTKEKVRS
ncbi:MAG: ABC-F family ATP-binding cassette domain-containing protein [Chloroflexota bacterium]